MKTSSYLIGAAVLGVGGFFAYRYFASRKPTADVKTPDYNPVSAMLSPMRLNYVVPTASGVSVPNDFVLARA